MQLTFDRLVAGVVRLRAVGIAIAPDQLLNTKNFALHALRPAFSTYVLTGAALTARCARWKMAHCGAWKPLVYHS
jgi:hypothetical protein